MFIWCCKRNGELPGAPGNDRFVMGVATGTDPAKSGVGENVDCETEVAGRWLAYEFAGEIADGD